MTLLDHPIHPAITFTSTCEHLADRDVEEALTTLLQTVGISAPCRVTHISEISECIAGIPNTCYVRVGDINGQDALWIFLRTGTERFYRILLSITQPAKTIHALKKEFQRRNEAIQRAIFTFFDCKHGDTLEHAPAPVELHEEPMATRHSTRRFATPSNELCAHVVHGLIRAKAHNGVVIKKGVGHVLERLQLPTCEGRSAVSLGHVFRTCYERGYFEHMREQKHAYRVTMAGVRLVLDVLGADAFTGLREGYVSQVVHEATTPQDEGMRVVETAKPVEVEADEYVLRERYSEPPLSRIGRQTHALEAVEALLLVTTRVLGDSQHATNFENGVRALFLLALHGVRNHGAVTRDNVDRSAFDHLPALIIDQVLAFLPEE